MVECMSYGTVYIAVRLENRRSECASLLIPRMRPKTCAADFTRSCLVFFFLPTAQQNNDNYDPELNSFYLKQIGHPHAGGMNEIFFNCLFSE